MPDFKRIVRPITALLGEQGSGVWEARHMEALNSIVEVVYCRMKLGLVDMSHGVDVHVDADQQDCCVVLMWCLAHFLSR